MDDLYIGLQLTHSGRFCRPTTDGMAPRILYSHPILNPKFGLSDEETETLFTLAEQERASATDYHQFTSLIAKNFSQDKKIKLIEYLWAVAYADGVLDKYEEHMVRRIADLIHVSHKDFMRTKHKFEK